MNERFGWDCSYNKTITVPSCHVIICWIIWCVNISAKEHMVEFLDPSVADSVQHMVHSYLSLGVWTDQCVVNHADNVAALLSSSTFFSKGEKCSELSIGKYLSLRCHKIKVSGICLYIQCCINEQSVSLVEVFQPECVPSGIKSVSNPSSVYLCKLIVILDFVGAQCIAVNLQRQEIVVVDTLTTQLIYLYCQLLQSNVNSHFGLLPTVHCEDLHCECGYQLLL